MKPAHDVVSYFSSPPLDGRTTRWRENLKVRFWAKVNILGPLDCWEWKGSKDPRGYGTLHIGHKRCHAQRIAYYLRYNRLSPDKLVLHSCDNPPCCNPLHLREGTGKDNGLDMCTRGRHAHGEKHPMAKTTNSKVREIRTRYSTGTIDQYQLAQEEGMSQSSIARILLNTSWRDSNYKPIHFNRIRRNEESPLAKLTWRDVREIREKYSTGMFTQAQLGAQYGVTQVLVGRIVRNKSWI